MCTQGKNKCWALNGQQFQPEVKGLRGLLRTYRQGPGILQTDTAQSACAVPGESGTPQPTAEWQHMD